MIFTQKLIGSTKLYLRNTHVSHCPIINLTGRKERDLEGILHGVMKNLLPYFRKSEDFHGIWTNARTHGTGGPIRIQLPEYTGMGDIYVKAAGELGYPRQDLNGYFTEGFDTIYYPMKGGRRHGVYGAFIEEAMLNLDKRLTVRQFAQATRAAKEVILSAGAMISPQLLMLSGIGPKEHLQELGIEVRADLPVGNNLQDHISAYLGPFFVNKPIAFSIERDVTSVSVANFLVQGRGILTTSGTNAMGFFASEHAKARGQGDWPDVQIILAGVSVGENFAKDFARGFGVKRRVLERYWAHAVGKDSFLQIVSLGRPRQRELYDSRTFDYKNLQAKSFGKFLRKPRLS
ncbi:Oxygen-dependent choline dehydrogenase [Orchesella cincta]|uniref:Oxygen-dependent choline dehydrogenase n=1 Tax=Orchesella cincta TaxID=48709 RepID=A0A1D2M3Z6_ORCCI|nr:Oxygen-dependent choline dehydrogenase [Orchesella cincta]